MADDKFSKTAFDLGRKAGWREEYDIWIAQALREAYADGLEEGASIRGIDPRLAARRRACKLRRLGGDLETRN